MSLHENVTTTSNIQALAHEVALYLETDSALKGMRRVSEAEVFGFSWAKPIQDLAIEVRDTTFIEVNKTLARVTGAKIAPPRNPEPGEKFSLPGVLLMNEAIISSSRDEIFLLLPIPISENTYDKILRRAKEISPELHVYSAVLGDTRLLLGSDQKREVKDGTKFSPEDIKLVSECVRFRTMPRLVPFLSIPRRILRAGAEQAD